jgi:lipopolysaccharide/colanic/teichoic acid biosynthesis glycosyltransferase
MSKRLFDIIISFTGLLVFGGLILMSVLAASIDTNKNGFFRQQRIGRFGKSFGIIKVRTMNDSNQISAFGRWMRRSKIDELPQLWNVLIGEMSFVGPRPDIAGYYDLLEGKDRKILELKPGLTSLASIKYANEEEILSKQLDPLRYNDEVVFPDKVKINLEYYCNHSVFGDIKIIMNTIFR